MKRLLALASLLVLGGSLGVTALFASSGATGARVADPSFAPSGPIPVGHLPFSVLAADLNGDGRPDLADAPFSWTTLDTHKTGVRPSVRDRERA